MKLTSVEKDFKGRIEAKQVTASTRNESFDLLSEDEQSVFQAIASARGEAIVQNDMLLHELSGATKDLSDKALEVIDIMSLTFDQKNESIEKLRSWRKTIESETKQAAAAIKELDKLLTTDRLDGLSALVDLIQELNKIKTTDIINKLLK